MLANLPSRTISMRPTVSLEMMRDGRSATRCISSRRLQGIGSIRAPIVRSGQEPIVVNLEMETPEPASAFGPALPFHPRQAG